MVLKKLFTIVFFTIFLSGCSFSLPANRGSGSVMGDETSKILWWGLFETEENISPLIQSFEEQFPEYQVEYRYWEDKEEYFSELNSVLTDENVNSTPDIFMIHNTWVGSHELYYIEAPEDIYSYSDFQSDVHEFVVEDFGFGEKLRGVPLWVDVLGMVYHKPYLVEQGFTSISLDFPEFKDQALKLNKLNEDGDFLRYGFSAGDTQNVEFGFEMLNLLFMQSRNLPLQDDARKVPFTDDEEDVIRESLLFYESFIGQQATWDTDAKLDTALFIEGKLASIVVPSWRILDFLSYDLEYDLKMDIAISEIPYVGNQVNFPTYWGNVVSINSYKTDACWELLKFLNSKETQEQYIEVQKVNGRPFSMISPRKDLIDTQLSEDGEYLESYLNSLEYTHSWYMTHSQPYREDYQGLVSGDKTLEDVKETITYITENPDILYY